MRKKEDHEQESIRNTFIIPFSEIFIIMHQIVTSKY